ncbi:molybdopterin molybdotransferase MoeA [Asaia bogorensis]|uniref:molybdopterin molybdotransferase MoeA n=1 Tax=Asaia bogorensis TaxID=91915 RepID=UPI000EFC6F2C|nr:molybdopterin molybdotransferase MoeA [Asaia bogorensis]
MGDLLDIETAERLIGETLVPFPVEAVPLAQCTGRVLRQDVQAERALPPYDRVILDGIAVRWQAQNRIFRLAATQPAGHPPLTLPPQPVPADAGSFVAPCIAVMTGSVLPTGADTVIPREHYSVENDLITLHASAHLQTGQHIHRRGADCVAGDILLRAGISLSPPDLAVLAANGVSHPLVAQIPSVAIISTGDELAAPDAPVADWQIRRSNEYAIAASLARNGFTRQSFAVLPDDLATLTDQLGALLAEQDVLVISGGVSMGQFDFVPQALSALGVRNIFYKVAQRPGKPFWFGVSPAGKPVFALPGNPVSALACCSRHVVPALLRAQGFSVTPRPVRLGASLAPLANMTRLVPTQLVQDDTGMVIAIPRPMPTSGDFNRLGATQGLISLPPGEATLDIGSVVLFHDW